MTKKNYSLKKIIPAVLIAMIVIKIFIPLTQSMPSELYGTVDIREVLLGFRVGGKIDQIFVEEGESVLTGQLLAKLDATPLEKQKAIIQAEKERATIAFASAEREFKRQDTLFLQKANTQREYDLAVDQYKLTQAQLHLAQAQLDQIQLQIEDTFLRAAEDGVIKTRVQEKGAIVSANNPIVAMGLSFPVLINSYAHGQLLPSLKPRQKVTIIDAAQNHYEGFIAFIAERAEFTPKNIETPELRSTLVYRLKILVPQAEGKLKQGMPVTVLLKDNV